MFRLLTVPSNDVKYIISHFSFPAIIVFFAFFLACVAAFVVSYPMGFLVRRYALRFGLVDKPGHRKIHDAPITTGGGLAIWCGVVLPLAVAQVGLFAIAAFQAQHLLPDFVLLHLGGLVQQSLKLWTLLGLGTILAVLGTLDDRYNLSWKLRIFVQFLVAIGAVAAGFRASLFLEVPLLASVLSVIWIVMLINSFNLLDNMNGLSAGVALICAAFLAAVMFLAPDPATNQPQLFLGGFLLVLIGAILGFLLHNNPFYAKMFMGDGGAYLIGFLLACTTLGATFTGYEVSRTTLFVPVLILAVPIYDTVSVVLIRLWEGRSPFEGDKRHFSHRLVDRGLTRTQAVLTIYLTTAVCAAGSLLLYQVNFFGAILIFTQTVLVLLLIAILESNGPRT